jgi:1-acyl-sn-glycerol-3-phosphate acyltransferase
MRLLQVTSRSPALPGDPPPERAAPFSASRLQVARSFVYFCASMLWLVVMVEIPQRLFLWPLAALLPARREAMVGRWIRFHAGALMSLARVLAGVRVRVRGAIAPGPAVLVMNHQSVLDIPLLLEMAPALPYPRIPARDRYRRGIPGVSVAMRIARYPFVTQKRESIRDDLASIGAVVEEVAAGTASIAIFPEGHRTRDGEIGTFMVRGLRAILAGAGRPVYCVVADGMWGARTMAEAAARMAGARVEVRVLGPFTPPAEGAAIDAFIEELRERMVSTLHEIRSGGGPRAA